MNKIKCKECPYYSGIQCHGHGEYWAQCNLLIEQSKIFKKLFCKEILETIVPKNSDCWGYVVKENQECKIFEIKTYGENNK